MTAPAAKPPMSLLSAEPDMQPIAAYLPRETLVAAVTTGGK